MAIIQGEEMSETRSAWDERKGHPLSDWKYEVASDDTRLGYHDWADHRDEFEEHEKEAE